MSTETTTLYEVLGGQETIAMVVDDFYKRILQDERINHYFSHLDMEKQREHQTAFISQVVGGPKQYTGRSMHEAHSTLKLTKADFNAVVSHLVATLESFQVPQVHIDTIISKIAMLEREVLGN